MTIVLYNDRSISRKHAVLEMVPLEVDEIEDLTKTPQVVLKGEETNGSPDEGPDTSTPAQFGGNRQSKMLTAKIRAGRLGKILPSTARS